MAAADGEGGWRAATAMAAAMAAGVWRLGLLRLGVWRLVACLSVGAGLAAGAYYPYYGYDYGTATAPDSTAAATGMERTETETAAGGITRLTAGRGRYLGRRLVNLCQ